MSDEVAVAAPAPAPEPTPEHTGMSAPLIPPVPIVPPDPVLVQWLKGGVELSAEDQRRGKELHRTYRLTPGPGSNSKAPADWKPTGRCEGVLYFGDVEAYDPNTQGYNTVKFGKEREALKYLLSPLPYDGCEDYAHIHKHIAEAADRVIMHPGQVGLCEPNIDKLLFKHREIAEAASEKGFPIERKFLSCRAGIEANQPQYMARWRVFEVEEGVWAVYFE